MAEDFSAVFDFFSSTFGVPSYWFEGTNLIFYFIIPVIAMVFFWYYLLNKRIRLIRSSSANFALGVAITLMSTAVFNLLPGHPTYTIIIGVVGSIFFNTGFGKWNVLIAIIAAIALGFILPMLMNYVSAQV